MSATVEQDWPMVSLDEVGEVNRGRSRHRPRYAEHLYGGPYPFIQTGDIKQSGGRITEYEQTYSEEGLAQSRLWPEGTMCITIAANIAETAILTFPACFPDSVVGFIADESKCNVRFIEYTFRNLKRRIQHEATGSVQDNINLGTLQRLKFHLPPLPEQRAIASILGALDDKIELNRRMNATLESLARAIFKSWFVDFDPVKINAGQMPADSISQDVLELFPSNFQDSQRGPIPEGWSLKSIDELLGFQGGFAFKSKDWQDEGVPVVKIGSVKPGIIDLSNVSYVSQKLAADSPRYQLGVGDLLIGMTGYVGEVGMVPPAETLPLLNQRVGKFVLPTEGTHDLPFWYCVTRSSDFREYVKGRSHGTAQANVSAKGIMSYTALTPPDSIVSEFNRSLEGVFQNILSNHAENELLARSRDELLPELLSGELAIPDEFLTSEVN